MAQTRLTAFSLLIANVLPLLGVLFWGWPLGKLLGLYWAESAVVGIFNIFKIMSCNAALGLAAALGDEDRVEHDKAGDLPGPKQHVVIVVNDRLGAVMVRFSLVRPSRRLGDASATI